MNMEKPVSAFEESGEGTQEAGQGSTVPPGQHFRIVLIGHNGKMGRMLRDRLHQAGHSVLGIDRVLRDGTPVMDEEAMASAVAQGDIILLSVPVTALEALMGMLGPMLKSEQLLMDITSVKVFPMQWMEREHPGPVIGSHPLFGPSPMPEQLRVILVAGKNAENRHCAMAQMLYESMGCSVEWASAREHDAGVALSQSLNFAVSASFFSSLAENPDVRRFLTPSFTRHLEAARKHLTVDTEMFCEFTVYNPCFGEAVERFLRIMGSAADGKLREIAAGASRWYNGG